MNKDTIIKVLLAIIALMVFAWLWRIISGMLIGTLLLTTSLLSVRFMHSRSRSISSGVRARLIFCSSAAAGSGGFFFANNVMGFTLTFSW